MVKAQILDNVSNVPDLVAETHVATHVEDAVHGALVTYLALLTPVTLRLSRTSAEERIITR